MNKLAYCENSFKKYIMKKVYIARRISKNPESKLVLNIKREMSLDEIFKNYSEKEEFFGSYIYNGPWTLRPPVSDDVFAFNNMPADLTPVDVWNMVKQKIESSDVFLGILNNKSFGTIAESGYACCCKNIAVYILPELGISSEELQDLWFVFQMAKNSKRLWCDEDIKMLDIFSSFSICSISQYEEYVSSIIPNFMKR